MSLRNICLWTLMSLFGVGLLCDGTLRNDYYSAFSYRNFYPLLCSLPHQYKTNPGFSRHFSHCDKHPSKFISRQLHRRIHLQNLIIDRLRHVLCSHTSESCSACQIWWTKSNIWAGPSFDYRFPIHGLNCDSISRIRH